MPNYELAYVYTMNNCKRNTHGCPFAEQSMGIKVSPQGLGALSSVAVVVYKRRGRKHPIDANIVGAQGL